MATAAEGRKERRKEVEEKTGEGKEGILHPLKRREIMKGEGNRAGDEGRKKRQTLTKEETRRRRRKGDPT